MPDKPDETIIPTTPVDESDSNGNGATGPTGATGVVTPEKIEPEVRSSGSESAKKVAKTGEEDDDILPEDRKVIDKVVNEALNPILRQVQEQRDQVELANFLSANSEYGKYRSKIEVYMKHPAYQNIPIKNIAMIVAGNDLQKIGAQKEREAQAAANATKGGGSTARAAVGQKNWYTASKDEFEIKRAEVLGRQGVA